MWNMTLEGTLEEVRRKVDAWPLPPDLDGDGERNFARIKRVIVEELDGWPKTMADPVYVKATGGPGTLVAIVSIKKEFLVPLREAPDLSGILPKPPPPEPPRKHTPAPAPAKPNHRRK